MINSKKLLKELYKHAQRDKCYDCKQLIRKMGLDPDKKFYDLFKEKGERN